MFLMIVMLSVPLESYVDGIVAMCVKLISLESSLVMVLLKFEDHLVIVMLLVSLDSVVAMFIRFEGS